MNDRLFLFELSLDIFYSSRLGVTAVAKKTTIRKIKQQRAKNKAR